MSFQGAGLHALSSFEQPNRSELRDRDLNFVLCRKAQAGVPKRNYLPWRNHKILIGDSALNMRSRV
jgi:hypothetical protein